MSSTNSTKTYNLWSTNGDEFIAAVIVLGKYVHKFIGTLTFSPNSVLKWIYMKFVIAFPELNKSLINRSQVNLFKMVYLLDKQFYARKNKTITEAFFCVCVDLIFIFHTVFISSKWTKLAFGYTVEQVHLVTDSTDIVE